MMDRETYNNPRFLKIFSKDDFRQISLFPRGLCEKLNVNIGGEIFLDPMK